MGYGQVYWSLCAWNLSCQVKMHSLNMTSFKAKCIAFFIHLLLGTWKGSALMEHLCLLSAYKTLINFIPNNLQPLLYANKHWTLWTRGFKTWICFSYWAFWWVRLFVGWLTEAFPAEVAEIMLSLSLHHLYVKISEMAGTIVVPGSRLCVADNQHCAGPGTYMWESCVYNCDGIYLCVNNLVTGSTVTYIQA